MSCLGLAWRRATHLRLSSAAPGERRRHTLCRLDSLGFGDDPAGRSDGDLDHNTTLEVTKASSRRECPSDDFHIKQSDDNESDVGVYWFLHLSFPFPDFTYTFMSVLAIYVHVIRPRFQLFPLHTSQRSPFFPHGPSRLSCKFVAIVSLLAWGRQSQQHCSSLYIPGLRAARYLVSAYAAAAHTTRRVGVAGILLPPEYLHGHYSRYSLIRRLYMTSP